MLAHWQNYDKTNLCQMGMLKDLDRYDHELTIFTISVLQQNRDYYVRGNEIFSYLRYLTQTNLGTKMEGFFQVSFKICV
jgi:hypothetical protein